MKNKLKKDKKQKVDKDMVYLGALCYLDSTTTMVSTVFLSDVYAIKEKGKYYNYFDRNEEFTTEKRNNGTVFFNIIDSHKLSEEEVFCDLINNPNYCKDRIKEIEKKYNHDFFNNEDEEMKKIKKIFIKDIECEPRYNSYMNEKEKVKVLKK